MKRSVVAITGGIGSGKSEITRFLREMGYATVDCDELARQIADEPDVIAAVEALLGGDCVTNGAINRKKVREIVFSDGELLKKYDEIFFSRVKQRLNETIDSTDGAVFVEIAVFGAFEFRFDEIWLVKSDESNRVFRVTNRDGVSKQSVLNVMSRQRYEGDFTRVFINDGSIDELKTQVLAALGASGLVKK